MIVTRQRKKPFPWNRILVPGIAIAVFAGALWWTPSRTWIGTGPLAPVWKAAAAPFNSADRERTIVAQKDQIASLQQQLADAQSQIADRDKQVSQMQTDLNAAQQQAALVQAARTPAAPGAQATTAPAADLSSQGTPDMRRTAQVWSAMDAESAARVVQRLPQDYVARVFALMSPDSVGAVLENLPASYAARLTQEHPELHR